jgi:superoxide oxidase
MPATILRRVADSSYARSSEDNPRGSGASSFDPVLRTAHWLTLFLILGVFATAFLMHRLPVAWSLTLQLHRSSGIMVWLVTILRLGWRQFARFPDWPANMSRAQQWAAQAMEYALYGLLLLQPILGLLHSSAHGGRVKVFFLFRLPPLMERNHDLADKLLVAHTIVAYLLFILIALHASAALFHHFIRRDETLTRMLPGTARIKNASRDCDGQECAMGSDRRN